VGDAHVDRLEAALGAEAVAVHKNDDFAAQTTEHKLNPAAAGKHIYRDCRASGRRIRAPGRSAIARPRGPGGR
jgi:hypothetical protein